MCVCRKCKLKRPLNVEECKNFAGATDASKMKHARYTLDKLSGLLAGIQAGGCRMSLSERRGVYAFITVGI